MSQLLSHNILGSQRSLVDYLTMVEGPDKPFMAMVKKGPRVDNVLYEWPIDMYEAAEDNAVVDGTDVAGFSNADADYAILSNRIQWIRDAAMVSKLSQNVQNQAGVKNKKAWAIQKKLERLWRNIEAMACSDNDYQTGTASVANKCRALGGWINNSATGVPTAFKTPAAQDLSGASSGFTEAAVQTLLYNLWLSSGKIKTYQFLCGGVLKQKFSDMTKLASGGANAGLAVRTYNQDMTSKTITTSIDRFVGDFGVLEIVPSQWLAKFTSAGAYSQYRGYVLDMEKIDVVWQQGPVVQELEDNGGGPRFLVDCIAGLRVYNPLELARLAYTS